MFESEEISRLFVELQVLKRIQSRSPAQSLSDAIILVQREISHRTQMAPQPEKVTLSREFFDFPSPRFHLGQAVFAGKEESFIGGLNFSPSQEWEYYCCPFSEAKQGSLKAYIFLESEIIPLAIPSVLPPLPEVYQAAIEKLGSRLDKQIKAASVYQSEEEIYKAS